MIMLLNSRIVMLKLWQLEFRQLDIRGIVYYLYEVPDYRLLKPVQ